MKNILFILGTRPEVIKLSPVILAMRDSSFCRPFVCNTEQQKELSVQTLDYFGLSADYNLDIMRPNHTLSDLNSRLLSALNELFQQKHFDAVVVQGDTMSVFAGACAAFFNRIPVCHVEAGLRSFDLLEPYPEEALRQMVTRIVSLHFAPTQESRNNLIKEGVPEKKIFMTGNTVIDALGIVSEPVRRNAQSLCKRKGICLEQNPVLVTVHRRENHGTRLLQILRAVKTLTKNFPHRQFVVPVHPNPNVKERVREELFDRKNVVLTDPLDYPELIEIMRVSHIILTDSGGIQEEAPTFGVPLLVMRYETERFEGVQAGFAKLVGAETEKIVEEASAVLSVDYANSRITRTANPYGDGKASQRILSEIENFIRR
jgi:UDP-N-acetylglucosamine 2-epimerase (non-hydrolysing)